MQNINPEVKVETQREKPRLWIPALVITAINIVSLVLFLIFVFRAGEWVYLLVWFVIVLSLPFVWKVYKKVALKQFFALLGFSVLLTFFGTILFGFLYVAFGLGAFDNAIFSTQNFLGGPKILWKVDLGQSPQLALEGDRIYTWSYYSSDLVAIDKASGETIKKYDIERNTTASDLMDGKLFKLKKGVDLLSVNLSTWQEEWSKNIEDYERPSCGSIVKAVDGRVYVGVQPGRVAAFDGENGDRLWGYEVDSPIDVRGCVGVGPLITTGNGIIFLGFADGSVYAVNAVSGKQVWRLVSGRSSLPDSLLAKDGTVYVTDGVVNPITYALNAETGKKMWQVPGTASGAANSILYVINNYRNLLQAIDRNGKITWQRELPHSHTTKLIVLDNILYYGSYNDPVGLDFSPQTAEFYAVNPQTGKTIWEYKISGQIQGNFVVDLGIVYLLKRNNTGTATELIALQPRSGKPLQQMLSPAPLPTESEVLRGSEPSASEEETWQTYRNDEFGFEMEHPSFLENGGPGCGISEVGDKVFVGPVSFSFLDAGGLTLQEFIDKEVAATEEATKVAQESHRQLGYENYEEFGSKLLSREEVFVGNERGVKLTFQFLGAGFDIPVTIYIEKENRIYSFQTNDANLVNQECAAKFGKEPSEAMELMLSTFRFTN